MSEYRHLSPKEQKAYIKARNERIVTLNVGDPLLKQQIKDAADADRRSVNNWLTAYILPMVREEMKRQAELAKKAKKADRD
jgi:hypothetical protein